MAHLAEMAGGPFSHQRNEEGNMMGKLLRVERWFDKTKTGTLRRKRVSAKAEAQFPHELRILYQTNGLLALVLHIRECENLGLVDAWARVERMFNDRPS